MNWFRKKKKITEKTTVRVIEAISGGVDPDDDQWRRLTGKARRDQLTPFEQDKMISLISYLCTKNPVARRLCEITKDFIIGDWIGFKAEDDQVQQILQDFWDDPDNNWDMSQHEKALEIGAMGEQCYPVFVNEFNGQVKIGSLDPARISTIETDPRNSMKPVTVVLKSDPNNPISFDIVNVDSDPASPAYGYLMGQCFYFAVNKFSFESRGKSDLLPLADWIDGLDQFLFSRLEKSALHASFVWDVTLRGMNEDEISKWLKKQQPPKPGSIRAHNENVEWNAVAPDLNASDAETEASLIKYLIFGGAGIPIHWFAEGGDVNRATAAEMGWPTLKRLAARQKYFKFMINKIFRFVIDQAIIHGTLSPEVDTSFEIIMPELSRNESKDTATSLSQLSTALLIAEQRGWLSKETAAGLFGNMAGQLGAKIDPAAEIEKAQADEENEKTKDYEKKKSE